MGHEPLLAEKLREGSSAPQYDCFGGRRRGHGLAARPTRRRRRATRWPCSNSSPSCTGRGRPTARAASCANRWTSRSSRAGWTTRQHGLKGRGGQPPGAWRRAGAAARRRASTGSSRTKGARRRRRVVGAVCEQRTLNSSLTPARLLHHRVDLVPVLHLQFLRGLVLLDALALETATIAAPRRSAPATAAGSAPASRARHAQEYNLARLEPLAAAIGRHQLLERSPERGGKAVSACPSVGALPRAAAPPLTPSST